ncbi:MAG: hypothetical protein ACKVHE_17250 [Planctomycetales bacterium]
MSATVVDAPVVETPVVDAPVTDAPVADTPVGEAPVEPPSTEAMGDDVWIEDVQATVIIGETQIDGNVFSSQGDYTGMTSTFGGVLSGSAVVDDVSGYFSALLNGELTGDGWVTLLDTSGNQLDQFDVFV